MPTRGWSSACTDACRSRTSGDGSRRPWAWTASPMHQFHRKTQAATASPVHQTMRKGVDPAHQTDQLDSSRAGDLTSPSPPKIRGPARVCLAGPDVRARMTWCLGAESNHRHGDLQSRRGHGQRRGSRGEKRRRGGGLQRRCNSRRPEPRDCGQPRCAVGHDEQVRRLTSDVLWHGALAVLIFLRRPSATPGDQHPVPARRDLPPPSGRRAAPRPHQRLPLGAPCGGRESPGAAQAAAGPSLVGAGRRVRVSSLSHWQRRRTHS